MPSRSLTFLQEIRDAIAASDRVVIVLGPAAVQSDYVRAEWQYALTLGRVVHPILRKGGLSLLPQELKNLQCPVARGRGLGRALDDLERNLRAPEPPVGPLLTEIPSIPGHYRPRTTEVSQLAELVQPDLRRPVVVKDLERITIVYGMGGVGKSVLAAAFARSTETRRAFVDGIVWLEIVEGRGQEALAEAIASAVSRQRATYDSWSSAREQLAALLEDKACLIVIDNVQRAEQLALVTRALGPRCRVLATTREADVSPPGARIRRLEPLSVEEGLQHLADWVGHTLAELPEGARRVAERCAGLPLATAATGAMAAAGTAWEDLQQALEASDLDFLRQTTLGEQSRTVLQVLKVSVDRLEGELRRHYLELGVFPRGVNIPQAVVTRLWTRATPTAAYRARQVMLDLERRSLLRVEGEGDSRHIRLHDLQHDLITLLAPPAPSLHTELLETIPRTGAWASCEDDGYLLNHLAYHLRRTGRVKDLEALLLDSDWYERKLLDADLRALLSDFDEAPDNTDVQLVRQALRLSSHVLTK